MKLSWQTTLFILFFINLLVAGMGQMQSMIQASEETERQAGIPADLRYCLPRNAEDGQQANPVVVASTAKS